VSSLPRLQADAALQVESQSVPKLISKLVLAVNFNRLQHKAGLSTAYKSAKKRHFSFLCCCGKAPYTQQLLVKKNK
jgi:hypothetical protein